VAHSPFLAPLEDAICKGLRPIIPKNTPPAYAQLIRHCWLQDPDSRPTASYVHQKLLKIQKSLRVLPSHTPPKLASIDIAKLQTLRGNPSTPKIGFDRKSMLIKPEPKPL